MYRLFKKNTYILAANVGMLIMAVGLYIDLVEIYKFSFLSEDQCACSSCVSDTTQEDQWFGDRFNIFEPTLLTKENNELSPLTKFWWEGLQHGPKADLGNVVENLFGLFPGEELYSDAGPDRYRTCAVVGNAGNLNQSNYGPLIDTHDFVIRMNQGPVAGFEKDVGSRTTHRVIYPESAVDLDNSTYLVFAPFKILDLQWLISVFTTKHITRTYSAVKRTIKANKDKVLIMHPDFMRYVYETWLEKKGKYPSTGFLALIFSLHICDQVSVFGFGASKTGNWDHYFDTKYYHHLNAEEHKGSNEYNIILKLHHKNKIKLYRGCNTVGAIDSQDVGLWIV